MSPEKLSGRNEIGFLRCVFLRGLQAIVNGLPSQSLEITLRKSFSAIVVVVKTFPNSLSGKIMKKFTYYTHGPCFNF